MVEVEEFPIALPESEAIEPMVDIPPELPVLPLRDIVIYPFMIVPLFVSRDRSIRAVEEALKKDRMILLVSQKDVNKEEPEQEDLYTVGTVAIIMRMLKLPDGRIRILIQGLSRCRVDPQCARVDGSCSEPGKEHLTGGARDHRKPRRCRPARGPRCL